MQLSIFSYVWDSFLFFFRNPLIISFTCFSLVFSQLLRDFAIYNLQIFFLFFFLLTTSMAFYHAEVVFFPLQFLTCKDCWCSQPKETSWAIYPSLSHCLPMSDSFLAMSPSQSQKFSYTIAPVISFSFYVLDWFPQKAEPEAEVVYVVISLGEKSSEVQRVNN